MALDYKLHKATEKKINELVDSKVDITRREKNLIDKIEKLQKDNKRLTKERDQWERQKDKETIRLNSEKKKVELYQKGEESVLKTITEDRDIILKDKAKLKKRLKKYKIKSKLTRKLLKHYRKKIKSLESRELQITEKNNRADKLLRKAEDKYKKAQKLVKQRKESKKEAIKLLRKAKKKNKEANGFKIKLGLEKKSLDERFTELKKREHAVAHRQQELKLAGREIMLKRRLLSQAYSSADIEDLDKKVDQMLASHDY